MCQNACQKWTLGDEEVIADPEKDAPHLWLLLDDAESWLIGNQKNFMDNKTSAISETEPALGDLWTQLTVLNHTKCIFLKKKQLKGFFSLSMQCIQSVINMYILLKVKKKRSILYFRRDEDEFRK